MPTKPEAVAGVLSTGDGFFDPLHGGRLASRGQSLASWADLKTGAATELTGPLPCRRITRSRMQIGRRWAIYLDIQQDAYLRFLRRMMSSTSSERYHWRYDKIDRRVQDSQAARRRPAGDDRTRHAYVDDRSRRQCNNSSDCIPT